MRIVKLSIKHGFSIFIILGIILIWLFPEADPAWWKGIEDLHDEVWWAENARRKILFNEWMWDEYAGALASGPCTVMWHYLSFKIFGIHFFSLRLLSLIPAALIPLIIKYGRIFKAPVKNTYIILLLSSSAYFALSRIAYVEMMLLLLFLIYLMLFQREHIVFQILAGLTLTLGLLFKGSFIYLLLPLLIWSYFSAQFKKKFLTIFLTFSLSSCLFYLFYFLPNNEVFEIYTHYFKSNFYDYSILLNPAGIAARLAWLPSKEWVNSPLMAWIAIVFLLKFSRGESPSFKNSAASLLVLCLLFVLFSDFSDRRLVFFIILIPLAMSDKFDKALSPFQTLVFSLMLLCPLITLFVTGQIKPDELIYRSFFIFTLLLSIVLTVYFLFRITFPKVHLLIFNCSILCFSIFSLNYSAITLSNHYHIEYYLVLGISILILSILFWDRFKKAYSETLVKTFILILCALQFVILAAEQVNPRFSLLEGSKEVSKKLGEQTEINGNNISLEILFLSNSKLPFELNKDHENICSKPYIETKIESNNSVYLTKSETSCFKHEITLKLLPIDDAYRIQSKLFY